MITNNATVEEQQRETSSSNEVQISSQNQVAVFARNENVVKAPSSFDSDDESSTIDDDENADKQVAEIRMQVPTDNLNKIVNTYTDCTNVTSTVQNTFIYKDGVTVIQNVYCCPPISLDCDLKWKLSKRRIIVIITSLLGLLVIIFLGLWFSGLNKPEMPHDVKTETIQVIIPTTEKLPNSTLFTTSSISTDPISSSTILSTSIDSSIANSMASINNGWKIIPREDWGAAIPKYVMGIITSVPRSYVIFSETGSETCTTTQKCKETVRKIQALHLKEGLRGDIMYNFLVGGDGLIYEGRGWDVHTDVLTDYDTDYFDDISISVSFIGNFKVDVPEENALKAAKTLLEFGVQTRNLSEDYKFLCLSQLSHKIQNPGSKLYDIVKMWNRWDSRTVKDFPRRYDGDDDYYYY